MGVQSLLFIALFPCVSAQNCPPRPVPVPLNEIPASLASAVNKWVASLVTICTDNLTPSVQYHMQVGQTILVSGAHGLARVSPAIPANTSTLYRIASVTKVFTSLLMYQLGAAGMLHADDPVLTVAPEYSIFDPWEGSNGSSTTLRHLASHMAGLGRVTPPYNNTAEALAGIADTAGMTAPAGKAPHYSNPGFALLGHLLAERVLSVDFTSALQTWITGPLQLESTGTNYSAPGVMDRLAPGYTADVLPPVPFTHLGFDDPAGGAYSTAADLNILLQAIGVAAAGRSTPLALSPATTRDFMKPLWLSDDATFQQGAPWEMYTTPPPLTYLVRGKTGGLAGYTSYVALVPDLALSAAVLFNGPVSNFSGLIAGVFADVIPALVEALGPLQPGPDPGPTPQAFVGVYSCSQLEGVGVIEFSPPPNGTAARGAGSPFPRTLRFVSELTRSMTLAAVPGRLDSFFAWVDPFAPGQPCGDVFGGIPDAYVTFSRSSGRVGVGNVTGFTIPFVYPGVTWTREPAS